MAGASLGGLLLEETCRADSVVPILSSTTSFSPFLLRHLGRILASVKLPQLRSDHTQSSIASAFNTLLMIRFLLHILLVSIGIVLADNCTVKPLVLEIRVSPTVHSSFKF